MAPATSMMIKKRKMDHLQNSSSSTHRLKMIREYSFLEKKKTPPIWRIFPSSFQRKKEQVAFLPQISASEFDKNPTTTKTIRLFGVNITANIDQEIITTDDQTQLHQKNTTTRKRKERNPNLTVAPVIPPIFHPKIVEGLSNQQPIFLFKKKLEDSDIASGLNRLLIRKGESELLMESLTAEERYKLKRRETVRVVTTDNADGAEYTLHLKMWPATRAIVLYHQWTNLVAANRFKKWDIVQVWGYRQDHQFRLALLH